MSRKLNCSHDYDDHDYHEENYDDFVVYKYNKNEEKTKTGVKKIGYKQVKTLKKPITKNTFYLHTN